MTDYGTLIDAETWAFIERTNSFYPPETTSFTIHEQRAVYDRLCRAFFAGYPAGVTAETTAIRTPAHAVPIRIYRSATPDPAAVVLYCHGGGFILGGLDSHDDLCAELCDRTGYELVSVDYRLAPEHLHPAPLDDAIAVLEWATSNYGRPVVVVGDASGGTLAAGLSHVTRGSHNVPVGQVLVYPGLGGDVTRSSYVRHANAPMLALRDVLYYYDIRGGRPEDPTRLPLLDTDFSRLPPTVIVTAECDPLSSDGESYRDRIRAAGGRAWWHEEPGLVHSYLRGRHMIRRAAESFARIADAVVMLGKADWRF